MGGVTEPGIVVGVETNAVWVEADRSAACGRCAARAGCGQGALSALLQQGKGTGFSLWAASWGDLWAASAFCLGLLSGFAILHQVSYRFQGRLPGMAEPRLASKAAEPHFELLAKQ